MRAQSKFIEAFPVPRFMTMPSIGVDISDASLKYIQFHRKGHHLTLESWGDLPIPDGTVLRGDLVQKDPLVAVLKEFRARTKAEYIRVSLPEERAYLFETTVPRSTEDIRSALEFHLEENVPLSPRDAYFDYTPVGRHAETGETRVSVAVYARETIEGYYDACREAGLVPISFEVEAQAIARAVIPPNDERTYMIVDFGHTRTGVGIVHCGALLFTSTVDVGGRQLSDALRKYIGERPESEYTKIKNEEGLLRGTGTEVHAALLMGVAALKDELATRINYWNLRGEYSEGRHIHKIILCGGSVNLAGLPEYMSEELEIVTERARVWQNAFSFEEVVPEIGRRYSYGYATAIGLALTDFFRDV